MNKPSDSPANIARGRPLRVMFLVGSLSTGGAERFVANAVTQLDRRRFKPFLALYRSTRTYDIPEDVAVKVLGKYRPWHNIPANLRLARWIDQVRPDVLLSAWSVPNVFAAEALRWTRHRPVWLARIANNPRPRETGLYGMWARSSYKRADGFIAVCQGLADAFVGHYPFAKGRVWTVYNGVDPQALAARAQPPAALSPDDAVHLLAVGRLHPAKRYDIMLRAVATARKEANVHLHVLGDGEERGRLQSLARELAIEDAVTWHGFQSNPYPYYAASDLFVLTSDYEGLSNALLEAQALGLPAIVTDCPYGNAEVVSHGETGLVARPGDAEAIGTHIAALCAESGTRERMGTAASERTQRYFSLRSTITTLETVLAPDGGGPTHADALQVEARP